MAAPPRPQQGPGGNLSLPPGANGAPGGGGPAAAEAAGAPAGPELSRPQQYTIPGILHYIQHEWARFEMERAHWEVERAELQVKGIQIKVSGEKVLQKVLRTCLNKRKRSNRKRMKP